MKVHTGALTLFLCSRRSFPAVHECTPPASMLRGTHGVPGPADNPHGGPAGRPNRSGPTPSRPVSAVVQGQDERITRDPAYRTCSTPCWPCWYTHVRMKPRAGYEGKVWARACLCCLCCAAGAATALSCPGNWVGLLEASPSGRPCRSYGARLLRAGASEGPASPGLAAGALLSRDGVARRLRESAQLLRTRSATLPRPVAGNGVQGGGLRALW